MNTELKQLLQETVVNVTFTKKDGTLRTMPCTLNRDLIPAEHAPKGDAQERKNSEVVQPVFVTDAGGWRSFRWDSVQEYAVVEGNISTMSINADGQDEIMIKDPDGKDKKKQETPTSSDVLVSHSKER